MCELSNLEREVTEEEGGFGDLYIGSTDGSFETETQSWAEGKFNRVKSIKTDPRKNDLLII